MIVSQGLHGSPLSAMDYAQLERSWISRGIADSAFLRRVDSDTGREIVGRRDAADYAGLVFPYLWPGNSNIRAYRLRRDNPPRERKGNLVRQREKYVAAPGSGNFLYFHPGTPIEGVSD